MRFMRWITAPFSPKRPEEDPSQRSNLLIQRAHAYLRKEEYNEARALLLELIAFRDKVLDPNVIAFALNALATTWILTEQYEEAVAFFSQYIRRYQKDPEAYSGRAAAFWYAGRPQDAIRDYSCALELNPTHILSLSGRGQVLAETGEYAKAIQDLESAL